MGPDYIVLAVPVFFLLIGVELVVSRVQRRPVYRLADSFWNMGTGVLEQLLTALFRTLVLFTAYDFVYERCAVFRFDPASPLPYVIAFVGADFFYYWWHRLSHVVNFLWAMHVVHHQSEEYNLTVALRQSWPAGVFAAVFYLPLAVLGIPPLIFLTMKSFMVLYQFWIHTRLIGRLGPVEWVMNTPSHHRVHHAINPRYLDRNFAGTFIVWDRLFGSFEPETETPVYGVLKPVRSWDPVWANLHSWVYLLKLGTSARRLRDRARVWFAHPGWVPGAAGGVNVTALFEEVRAHPYDPPLSRRRGIYLLTQFLVVLGAAAAFLFKQSRFPLEQKVAITAFLAFSLFSLGAWAERRRVAPFLEIFRLALAAGAAFQLLR